MLTNQRNTFAEEFFNINGYPALLGQPLPFFEKLKKLLLIYGLIFLCLPAVGLLGFFADYVVTHLLHFKSIYNQADVSIERMIRKIGRWPAFGYVCLVGPVLEESTFRLPLSFKKNQVIFSCVLGIFFLGSLVCRLGTKNIWVEAFFAIVLPLTTWLVSRRFITKQVLIRIKNYKTTLIIVSICLFGLMHISNYVPIQWAIIFIYPVFVIPQMLMGWGFTYIRYKNGFFWGVAIHCLNNTVAMFIFSHFR